MRAPSGCRPPPRAGPAQGDAVPARRRAHRHAMGRRSPRPGASSRRRSIGSKAADPPRGEPAAAGRVLSSRHAGDDPNASRGAGHPVGHRARELRGQKPGRSVRGSSRRPASARRHVGAARLPAARRSRSRPGRCRSGRATSSGRCRRAGRSASPAGAGGPSSGARSRARDRPCPPWSKVRHHLRVPPRAARRAQRRRGRRAMLRALLERAVARCGRAQAHLPRIPCRACPAATRDADAGAPAPASTLHADGSPRRRHLLGSGPWRRSAAA